MDIKKLFSLLVTSATALMIMSCDIDRDKPLDPLDRSLNLSRQDYRELAGIKEAKKSEIINEAKTLAPPIPKVAPILAAPRPPKIQASRLVSIAVSDDVPLKDVLLELSRLADIDIEIDSGIQGGISFRAKDRPFNEVVERIANMAGLRYSMKNGVLRIERDNAYVNNYNLSFLNMVRSSQSSVNISTDVLSAGGGEGGGGITTGSTSSISAEANDDFWTGLETSVSQILSSVPISRLSGQSTQETETVAAAEGGSSGSFAGGAFYVVNRQAGMLSISGSQRQHELVSSYLEQIKASASAQVLIEAKIVEVTLTDEYKTGINWDTISNKNGGNNGISATFNPGFTDATNITTASLDLENFGLDIRTAVSLVEKFGTTRTLSSPRLHAINNQPAVLTFAENRIFFEVTVEREDDELADDGTTLQQGSISVESERRSVPIGIILNILPSIDTKRNEVTLNVRPTLSRQVGTVTDPGSALINQLILADGADDDDVAFTNEVPIVEVRELDSIMKLRSGQVMVIGGLMEQTSTNTDTGTPFLGDVPFLGNLFKGVEKVDETTELVIFIRATIVTPHGNYHDADKKVYENFTNDPRPLNF